jgi:hypothetical protein
LCRALYGVHFLQIKSFALIDLYGVSTNKTIIFSLHFNFSLYFSGNYSVAAACAKQAEETSSIELDNDMTDNIRKQKRVTINPHFSEGNF